jgi:hypothetical protein
MNTRLLINIKKLTVSRSWALGLFVYSERSVIMGMNGANKRLPLMQHLAIKSFNSGDHFDGSASVGGGLFGIKTIARNGCISV